MSLPPAFLRQGGTEIAPMSTTPRLDVAVRYSASASSVLLKLTTSSFMERGVLTEGLALFPCRPVTPVCSDESLTSPLPCDPLRGQADLTFLSCYPAEAEILFPPLTYLQPAGEPSELLISELGVDDEVRANLLHSAAGVEIRYTVLEVVPKI